MSEKIGVYICECGPNIKEALDIEEVVKYASTLENVVLAKPYRLLCSDDGRELLKNEIKEMGLNRLVIAACSPKEHEATFMKVAAEAGLNPYLIQIANIREHCAWVIDDKAKATEKAKVIIRTAVKRVSLHEPLEKKEIDCTADVLVVGAGVAGIEAVLTLAQKDRKVFLVDKAPYIGGKVAAYEEVFPKLECAPCMLEPKLAEVLHNENIQLLTYSEVEEVLGYLGSFIVRVKKKARSVDMDNCIGCKACFEACPVTVKNEYDEGLSERKAIFTPYAGSLPNVPVIDRENCLRFKDGSQECEACKNACPFGAVNLQDQDEVIEIKAGAIVLATGFDLFDPVQMPQYGYGKFDNVYTGMEFGRVLCPDGPTGGEIVLKNGEAPKSVAVIHCAGSRTEDFCNYCSGVCCMYSLTFSHLIKKKSPDTEVFNFYSDFSLAGKDYQKFCNKVADEGVTFIRTVVPNSTEVNKEGNSLVVKCKDVSGETKKVPVDMVILATAMVPNKDNAKMAEIFDITLDSDGFFAEEHGKLAPVSTPTGGIFIAGCCQGPKDIQSSVAQGSAAAGKILSSLVPGGKLELEAMVAEEDEELCSGCKVCIGLCPYKAITFDEEKKVAVFNDILCKGCGTCTAACPSGAAKSRHFTTEQIFTEIQEAVR